LLRAYLSYVPETDGYTVVWKAEAFLQQYPYSPVSANVDVIKEQSMTDAETWFNALLAEADLMVAEKQFQQALDLLQMIPAQNLAPERHEQLKQRIDELILTEAVDRETTKIEQMQGLQRTWNEAMALAESGDADGAIAALNALQDTEFAARADEKIVELSEQAARDARRTAADLFVRSTKTDDIQSRKDLLVESRRVLKDILLKYPEADVSDKVEGNIRMVEKKMNELDPMLLPVIEEQEKERTRAQQMSAPSMDETDPFGLETPAPPSPPPATGRPLPVLTPQAIQ
jgi:tetratricopeptide (TPR) repeat protein